MLGGCRSCQYKFRTNKARYYIYYLCQYILEGNLITVQTINEIVKYPEMLNKINTSIIYIYIYIREIYSCSRTNWGGALKSIKNM